MANIKENFDEVLSGMEEDMEMESKVGDEYWIPDNKSCRDLKAWFDDGRFIFDSDWQRQFVWSDKQKSLLIESLILNFGIPNLHLYEVKEIDPETGHKTNRYEIIDGLQRLTTLKAFFSNEFALSSLEDKTLKDNPSIYKKKWQDLPISIKQKLLDYKVSLTIYKYDISNDVKYSVFKRLSQGGTPLNAIERYNVVYRGKTINMIKEFTKNPLFIKLAAQKCIEKRMSDVSIILQFLAYYDAKVNEDSPLLGTTTFFRKYLQHYQNHSDAKIQELTEMFNRTMNTIYKCFYDPTGVFKLFRLSKKNYDVNNNGIWITQVSSRLFSIFCYAIAISPYSENQFFANKDKLKQAWIDLASNNEHFRDIFYRADRSVFQEGNKNALTIETFRMWSNTINSIIGEVSPDRRLFSKDIKDRLWSTNKEMICPICNQSLTYESATVDHIIPYSKGGATSIENAQLVHSYCNSCKQDKDNYSLA